MKHNAFTLIELSIVLVIIGLIVGGVLVGKDLIRAAELRSIISELENFKTATNTFRLKYNCLPDDCPNASQFFSGVQNGNGDGYVQNTNLTADWELFTFWKQLSDANLISGTFTGLTGSGTTYSGVLGENLPRSKFPNAGWALNTAKWVPISPTLFFSAANSWSNNLFSFGAQYNTNLPHTPVLSGIEALSIDLKVDDGSPALGNVQSWINGNTFSPNCATTNNASAIYSSSSTAVCAIYFNAKF